jgi:hypothetical protein
MCLFIEQNIHVHWPWFKGANIVLLLAAICGLVISQSKNHIVVRAKWHHNCATNKGTH